MNLLSSHHRKNLVQTLSTTEYDLVVIGGGITGAGIALDAASRGLKTALVEKRDFASGTSSRSTKLIHGGLRYLKQFEIALVREVGRERATVHRLAPHLVTAEKMLLPIIKDGTYGKMATSVGLMVYDVLAGVERADQRVMFTKEQTLEHEPLLEPEDLEGGGYYAEYRTDDARLTIEVIKTAEKFKANSINYCLVEDFSYNEEGIISGVNCKNLLDDNTFNIKSKFVVSAAGPWVDTLRKKNNSMNERRLYLTKGVHLVVDHKRFPVKQAIYFDVPDGRMIFAIPRGKITYIGTTDTPYDGNIDEVKTCEEDANYLLEAVNHTFPKLKLKMEDVISNWAGLRPLIFEEGKSASELSRKDEIFESETGLISIAGGKLTGYRKMAERVVDRVAKKHQKLFNSSIKKCFTNNIVLMGGAFKDAKHVDEFREEIRQTIEPIGLDHYDAFYLVHNYGMQTPDILKLIEKETKDAPELALMKAELKFTVENELVAQADDFFERRSGRYYFNIQSLHEYYEVLLEQMQELFQWDNNQLTAEKKRFSEKLHEANHFEKENAAIE